MHSWLRECHIFALTVTIVTKFAYEFIFGWRKRQFDAIPRQLLPLADTLKDTGLVAGLEHIET